MFTPKNYTDIVLDFSALFLPLPGDFWSIFSRNSRCWTAPSYPAQHTRVSRAVPDWMLLAYKENLQRFSQFTHTYNCSSCPADTLSVVQELSRQGGSVLLVSANCMLNTFVCSQALRADIYDLWSDRIIPPDKFPEAMPPRCRTKTTPSYKYADLDEGSPVYAFGPGISRSGPYSLGEEISMGAEARIFRLKEKKDLLAKIYLEDSTSSIEENWSQLTREKVDHLHDLMDMGLDVSWLSLPRHVLCADRSGNRVVGYAMPYFPDVHFLMETSDHPLLFISGVSQEKMKYYSSVTVGDVLDLMIQLVSQVMFLACWGVYLTDYNPNNFTWPAPGQPIQMIDVDSFCHPPYISDCHTYSPSIASDNRLSRNYNLSNPGDLAAFCSESLIAFVFSLLELNSDFPFYNNDIFILSNQALYGNVEKFLPPAMRDYFLRVFVQKERPSMEALLSALETARSSSFAQKRYVDIYASLLAGKKPAATPVSAPVSAPVSSPVFASDPASAPPSQKPAKSASVIIAAAAALLVLFFALFYHHVSSIGIKPFSIRYDFAASAVSFTYENGALYKGETEHLIPHGQGEMSYNDGKRYEGEFRDGVRAGEGTLYYEEDSIYDRYEGEFRDGDFEGEGVLYFKEDSVYDRYEGEFRDGDRYKVALIDKTGKRYTGEYSSDTYGD